MVVVKNMAAIHFTPSPRHPFPVLSLLECFHLLLQIEWSDWLFRLGPIPQAEGCTYQTPKGCTNYTLQRGVFNAPSEQCIVRTLWGCSWMAAISQVHPFAKKLLHPKGCTNFLAFKATLYGVLKPKMAAATPLWVHWIHLLGWIFLLHPKGCTNFGAKYTL